MRASDADTIPKMFFSQVTRLNGKTALLHKKAGRYRPITWNQLGEKVREIACGLIELGVRSGDRVAIMSYNRPEWAIADLAILACGAITIPIYHTSTSHQTDYILKKSGVNLAFVARSEKAEMLATCDAAVQKIISLDPVGADSAGSCAFDYEYVRKLGKQKILTENTQELDNRTAAIRPDDCATIIFTSGTTGNPKGVMLSHSNILTNVASSLAAQPVNQDDTCLSFLPLSHSFERTVGHFLMLQAGATIAYASSIRAVAENLQEVQPTIMLGVPRFYEKLHTRVTDAANNAPPMRQKLFQWAMKTGRRLRENKEKNSTPDIFMRLQHFLAEKLVFTKLKKKLGGRIRFFISGGAPLAQEIIEFFLDAGIQILEGYGLTEYSPVIAVNRLHKMKPGTVGIPLPHCQVKITEDSEVLVKGPSIMLGYYQDYKATLQVIQDGWLATGDLGKMEKGFLRILDRKKDIIVNSGGKNISPQFIENLLSTDEYISQTVLYGDKKNFLTALIVPDFDHFSNLSIVLGLSNISTKELAGRQELHDFLMARITQKSKDLAPFETVRKIIVLQEPLAEEKGELTPTMKVKRRAVIAKYRNQLDALYKRETSSPKSRARWP